MKVTKSGIRRVLAVETAPAAPQTFEGALQELALKERMVERLGRLVEISKILYSTLDLGELFPVILQIATEYTRAERASLFLLDPESGELWTLIAQGLDQKEIRLPVGTGLVGWVAQTGQTLNIGDAYGDPRFDASTDLATGYRTRNVLVAAVKDRTGRCVGVLQLLNKPGGPFSEDDVEFVDGISVHAAIALDNARLHRDSLQRQRLERELDLARTIQGALLPQAPPVLEGFDIAVRHESSSQMSGDYYDFIALSATTQLFLIADVEGKGAAAAMVMATLQATLHTLVKHVHSLEGILFNLNERILEGTRGGKYMTLFVGLLDLPRRALHYVNAGHVAPYLLRPEGAIPLREGGMVVGLLPSARYKRGVVQLQSGDVVLTCTDGITEADNPADQEYGLDRLAARGLAYRERPAREIVDAIFGDVLEFSRGGAHQDDRVVMAVKVL